MIDVARITEFVLSAFGGGVVALGLARWLFERWIDHRLNRETERHKTELSQKVEVLKTELSIYAHEQNVGLTRIDAQRSEAVEGIWKVLLLWNEDFMRLVSPNESLESDPVQAVSAYRNWAASLMERSDMLSKSVGNHAIYFDEDAYLVMARCGMAISEVTNDFYAQSFEGVKLDSIEKLAAHLPTVQRTRQQLKKSAEKSVTELRTALVAEFRRIMKASKLGRP